MKSGYMGDVNGVGCDPDVGDADPIEQAVQEERKRCIALIRNNIYQYATTRWALRHQPWAPDVNSKLRWQAFNAIQLIKKINEQTPAQTEGEEMTHQAAWNLVAGDLLLGICYLGGPVLWLISGTIMVESERKDITALFLIGALIFEILSHLISAGVIR